MSRLKVTFHETFIPERRFLGAIMDFAENNGSGTFMEIGEETGIPTGESTGKVNPTIKYAESMNLIKVENYKETNSASEKLSKKALSLTDFGRVIHSEDKFIGEKYTQWLLHLNLCGRFDGAEIWYQTFARTNDILGQTFSQEALEKFLENNVGNHKNLIGPMLNMYEEAASFGSAKCLYKNEKNLIERKKAPLEQGYFRGYASLLLSLWERVFPEQRQVTLDEFEKQTEFFAITGWSQAEINEALEKLINIEAINVERYIGSPLLFRLEDPKKFIESLYSDLS